MIHLFHTASEECSQAVTRRYSTSFASAIRMLHKDHRAPVCGIYGFVRLADEIVDSFHDFDKAMLLHQFEEETYASIQRGLSLNPVLHSFQMTVNRFDIDPALINAFFRSMEMDLTRRQYDADGYREYIYGSAEAVGLMCLHVFCEGKKELYDELKPAAASLGAAFQKVNFLRDIKSDYAGLSRMYFPCCDFDNFTEGDKKNIENDIYADFSKAYKGILHLPMKARFGVYVAYKYYFSLFTKITKLKPANILQQRVRIPAHHKLFIIMRAAIRNQLRLIAPRQKSWPGVEGSF